MKTLVVIATAGIVLGIAGALFWARVEGPLRDPHEALAEFYRADQVAEDQLADPLIRTRCRSANLVAHELRSPNMPLRRYAIGYIGNRRCREGLQVLMSIVNDPGENDLFRGDALEAIFRIEQSTGSLMAHRYEREPNFLGERAGAILRHDLSIGFDRSYFQAAFGGHE